jgi:hypothetical protein
MSALIGLALLTMTLQNLPVGSSPRPVALRHFPDAYHAYVWRNWSLVPLDRIALAIGATREQILDTGLAMGLPHPAPVSEDRQMRSALTVIRRNWHLLPYDQLLTLLHWTPQQLSYTLREDDFLYIKLGSLKPNCEPVRYTAPTDPVRQREAEIKQIVRHEFPGGLPDAKLFEFVRELSRPLAGSPVKPTVAPKLTPRFCYSYFALYGDPLLDKRADPYPDAYLARLHQSGVDGVWLQGVLNHLAPFPWDPSLSDRWEQRLANLKELVRRARAHGIGVYLYLNEPRSMPLAFFAGHPELKGVTEGDHAALCTSAPEVQRYLASSVETVCRAVPDLAGFLTITGSENLTNCWSHGAGMSCPRCGPRGFAQVVSEVNALILQGIHAAGAKTSLIAWDWGWPEGAAEETIRRLPPDAGLMSVSEWDLPIHRGGVATTVGEYSLSAVGPGPRATRHWKAAQDRGLKTLAKIQAANSWEMSAVPYVPAVANSAQHAANLRSMGLSGIMLGWTLGGYPSPNLEVVAAVSAGLSPEEAMHTAAARRFGKDNAGAVVRMWKACSAAYSEFPFHIGLVYTAPLQQGPSNLMWGEPTSYHATMVGFAYDDLQTWRAVYPPDIFASQLHKTAAGFEAAARELRAAVWHGGAEQKKALELEAGLAETVAIHFESVANQAKFIMLRDGLAGAAGVSREQRRGALHDVLNDEIRLAHRLLELQARDPRIGFEASNQYYYVGTDLMEKILNCIDLRDRWLPGASLRSSP